MVVTNRSLKRAGMGSGDWGGQANERPAYPVSAARACKMTERDGRSRPREARGEMYMHTKKRMVDRIHACL